MAVVEGWQIRHPRAHVEEAKENAAAAAIRADKIQEAYDKLLDDLRQHMIADAASLAKSKR